MAGSAGRAAAAALLIQKQAALAAEGLSRYPQRADFSAEEAAQIKAHLGPWPRALEAAGLKPPRDDGFAARQKEKRIVSKRRRTAAKIAAKKTEKESSP